MNDDELDLLLREAPRPQSERREPKQATQRVPVWELAVFALVATVVLAWAAAVLTEIGGG